MEFADDQSSSRITLDDGTVLTKCDQCRNMWAERNARGVNGDPPCESCRVELRPENEQPAMIYRAVRNQVVTVFNGERNVVIDLNYPAVKMVMDLYGVKNQRDCFEKVLGTFHHFLKGKE